MRMGYLYAKWKGYKHISVYSFLPVLKCMYAVNNKSYEIIETVCDYKTFIYTYKNRVYSFYIFFLLILC